MNCACCNNFTLVDRVGHLLDKVKAIDIDDLEDLVQVAHESTARDMDDPPQPFPISRQAIRMLWMFRRNLEAVDVRVEDDE